jgi:hypothetical protein
MFVIFGTALALIIEFTRLRRPNVSSYLGRRGLSGIEVSELTHWCPRWLIVAVILLLVYEFAVLLPLGRISWGSDRPFTQREALGVCFGLSIFVLLSLPVLASASRMPGTFAEHTTSIADHGA